METDVRYPNIEVELVGENGIAFGILGMVTRALGEAGVPKEERDLFIQKATGGDYNDLFATCMKWVEVV